MIDNLPAAPLPTLTCNYKSPVAHITPVKMNTVKGSNGIAKTIEATTEVSGCDLIPQTNKPTKIKDVTIFAEAFENLRTRE
jgi:hypothetical protein